MKPEMKLEGDVLKISLAQEVKVDTDKDGVAALSGVLSGALSLDGSEVLKELAKSSALFQKMKDMVGLGEVKAEG